MRAIAGKPGLETASGIALICGWLAVVACVDDPILWKLAFVGPAMVFLGSSWCTMHEREPGAVSPRLSYGIDVLAAGIPMVVVWLLYHDTLWLWWRSDDPAILKSIIDHGILRHFYDPEVWRQFTVSFVTPWVQLSLGLDYYLHGLDPAGFYIHHLAALAADAAICFVLLRCFFPAHIASLVVCLLVISRPTLGVAQLLMTRHYVEGLGLAGLATICFVGSVSAEGGKVRSFAGCVAYALACTAKEIYVPLVVLLPFLPAGTLPRRLRAIKPYLLVAIGYVGWRTWMLGAGNVFTGYGDRGLKVSQSAGEVLQRIDALLGWSAGWQWVVFALALAPLFWVLVSQRRVHGLSLLVLAAALCAVPLIPVLGAMTGRYLFLPVLVACIVAGAGLVAIGMPSGAAGARRAAVQALSLLLLLSAAVALNGSNAGNLRQADDGSATVGKFILHEAGDNVVLLHPPVVPWFVYSLSWIRDHTTQMGPGPRACYDVCACSLDGVEAGYRYEDNHRLMVPVDVRAVVARNSCGSRTVPLSVELRYEPRVLHWSFGPARGAGRYEITAALSERGLDGYFYAVGPHGNVPTELKEPLEMMVKYTTSGGVTTYSPVLTVDPRDTGAGGAVVVSWQR